MPDARTVAQRAFALLAQGLGGDRSALARFADAFTADAVLWLPPTPNTRSPYVGQPAIRRLLLEFVANLHVDGLRIELFGTLDGGSRVAFQFEDRGTHRDGRRYENSPVITLLVRRAQIAGFWEYWGGPGFFSGEPPDALHAGHDAAALAFAAGAFAELQRGLTGDGASMTRFLGTLDEGVRIWFPPTPNTRSPCVGIAAARQIFGEFLPALYPRGLYTRRFHTLAAGHRIAFELQSFGIRRDGSEYLNSPMFCMEVAGARIVRIWEHWGAPGCFDAELRAERIG